MKTFRGTFIAIFALVLVWWLTQPSEVVQPSATPLGDDAPNLFQFEKSALTRVDIVRHEEELHYECTDRPNNVHPLGQRKQYRLCRPFTVYRRLTREGTSDIETLYYCVTPHSSGESTQYLYILRNFELEPGEFEARRELTEHVMNQDRRIVENQHPEELTLDLAEELHIKGPDAISVAYRRLMAELDVHDGPPR